MQRAASAPTEDGNQTQAEGLMAAEKATEDDLGALASRPTSRSKRPNEGSGGQAAHGPPDRLVGPVPPRQRSKAYRLASRGYGGPITVLP